MDRTCTSRWWAFPLAFALASSAVSFVAAAPAAAEPTITSFTQTFDTEVATSASQAPGVWFVDRYAPAVFESTVFDSGTRLKLGINAADSAATRPPAYSSSFYNTQGRKYDLGNPTGTYISGDVFISSDFETKARRTDLWATATTDTADAVAYPIFGFVNGTGFRVFSQDTDQDLSNGYQGGWVPLGVPAGFTYGTWHNLRIELTDSAFLYYLDGSLVFTDTVTEGATRFADMMVQAYNYGETYNVYWDDISAGPIVPVPAPDTTAPVTKVTDMSAVSGKAELTLSATDGESGVASTKYRVDGGDWTEGTTVSVRSLGDHVVEYYSVDVAGNPEAPKSVNVSVWGEGTVALIGPAKAPAFRGSADVSVVLSPAEGLISASAVTGKLVRIEMLVGGAWVKHSDVALDSSGRATVPLSSLTKAVSLRALFPEQAPFTAMNTDPFVVKPQVYLGKPSASSRTVTAGSRVRVRTRLEGRHDNGSKPITFVFQRLERQKNGTSTWVTRVSVKGRAKSYRSYSMVTATTRLKLRGSWRVLAVHAEDLLNAATTSQARKLRVK